MRAAFRALDGAPADLDRARLLIIGTGLVVLQLGAHAQVSWLLTVAVALHGNRHIRRALADTENAVDHERLP